MFTIYDEVFFFDKVKIGDSFRPRSISYILVYRGTLTVELNGFKSVYQAGNIALISSENLYKINDYSRDLSVYFISTDREKIRQKISLNFNRYYVYRITFMEKKGAMLYFEPEEFAHLISLAQQLAFYINNEKSALFRQEVTTALFSALIYITAGKLLENTQNPSLYNSRKEQITLAFIESLNKNFRTERGLQFYADEQFVSIKYLSNSVREVTGIPPSKFIDDALINESKTLLLNSKDPINLIASQLHFSDQYAFGKYFKKHSGLSPKNFKAFNKLVDTF
ncbi:helix-turn-helix domain-containing protein [Flavobacterium sp. JP2137]|uniref:helix-turn-helix domain-containing protein n=1 Tax=Flavobacterium sp. JP2137 TaxID=3414510 RepID=UPI003D300AB6